MIKILGIGNAGNSIVNLISKRGIYGATLINCNTSSDAITDSKASANLLIGSKLLEGMGSGSVPDVGKNAALESRVELYDLIGSETKMLILIAGLGGGTGSGAISVISEIARDMGILTVAIVTTPFSFEGKRRIQQALDSVEMLKQATDSFIILSNDKLRKVYENLTLSSAYEKANDLIYETSKAIVEMITSPGYINVDLKDLRLVLKDSGLTKVGIYEADGEDRARNAISTMISSPLMNNKDIKDAKYLLINISAGRREVTMEEISIITDFIQEEAGLQADLIWGNTIDQSLEDKIKIVVVATGFEFETNIKSARAKIGRIEDIILTSRNKEVLSLYFLEDEYTTEEIAEVLSFLSDLYRNEGGDELIIKGNDVLEFESVLETF